MATEQDEPKIGAGHAEAMFRQGLSELRAALYNEGQSAAQPAQMGLYGTSTQREIYEGRRSEGPEHEAVEPEQASSLLDRIPPPQRDEPNKEPEPPDRG